MRKVKNSSNSFHFEFIPDNPDKNCINMLKSSNNEYSIEYSIFPPKTVHISMHTKTKRRIFPPSDQLSSVAIQSYATAMGLHPDFHLIGKDPIQHLLKMIKGKFSINNEGGFISTGLKSKNIDSLATQSPTDSFIDGLLEILTNKPVFAFIQINFSACKTPREFRFNPKNEFSERLLFDIQNSKVKSHYTNFKMKDLEEKGFFNFCIRVLVVELEQEHINSKLEQVRFFFACSWNKIVDLSFQVTMVYTI